MAYFKVKSLTDTTAYATLRKSSSIDCHYNKNTLFQRWRLYSKTQDQPSIELVSTDRYEDLQQTEPHDTP